MATANQFARSINSAIKAAERENARAYKQQLKEEEMNDALNQVRDYEYKIEEMISQHIDFPEKIDWNDILNESAPETPINKHLNETDAKLKLANFKPNFLDKIFGTKKKIKRLEKSMEIGKQNDLKEFEYCKEQYSKWEQSQKLAKSVLNKDSNLYVAALDYVAAFEDDADLRQDIKFKFESETADIELEINDIEVIPDYILSLTKSGKLSKRNMPKGKFNELYQDYVCSSLLSVGQEIFAYLPIKTIKLHAMANVINKATGHLEYQPIVSTIFSKETFENLNFESLEPSNSMSNFDHNMSFSKTKGFSPVEKVKAIL